MPKPILGICVSETNYASVCDRIQSLIQTSQSTYIVAANVHVIMTAYWNPRYRDILNKAALVTPDGMPLVWGMRWLGAKKQTRVYGPDLMLAWCDRATHLNSSIYLYGSTPQTLQRLSAQLHQTFPHLKIAGTHSPPFRTLTPRRRSRRHRTHSPLGRSRRVCWPWAVQNKKNGCIDSWVS